MKLPDAKALRDEIKSDLFFHCIVPLGHGPDRYFVRIFTDKGARDFHSLADVEAYLAEKEEARRQREEARRRMMRPRSPLEAMIDRACGITAEDYQP